MTKHKGVKMTERPEGTTHKNPWLNRYGATCFDWFKIDPETEEVFQWYIPYMEHQYRWALLLSEYDFKKIIQPAMTKVEHDEQLALIAKKHCGEKSQ